MTSPDPLPADVAFLARLLPLVEGEAAAGCLPDAVAVIVEATGARAAALVPAPELGAAGPHVAGPGETAANLAERALARLDAPPDPARRGGSNPEIVRLPGDPPLLVRISDVPGPAERAGALALAIPAEASSGRRLDVADHIASFVLGQVRLLRDFARVRAEKAQKERWFNVMDTQLRVLDRERQKFVAVVNQSDKLMFVVDADRKVPWTNHALAAWFEEQGEPVPARGAELAAVWTGLGLAVAERPSECPVALAFRSRSALHRELTRTVRDETRNLYVSFLPIQGPDGRTAEVLVTVQDLSDLDVVRRSEARYRLLFERSPDAMLMMDPPTGKIVLANPEAALLTGWSPAELVGMPVERLHDPDDWPRARLEYERVFVEDGVVASEWHLRAKDERRLVANVSATRFDLEGQQVVLLQIRDVTETKLLETELRHSQKMEAIGRLAGGVAHDFNNLLTVILGQSELLERKVGREPSRIGAVDTIRKSALRGSLLTRQLLAFSRKEVLKRDVIDVNDVVRGIERLLKGLLGERVRVEIDPADEPAPVLADRGQIEQILMNLAVNARDAMPDGGSLRIRVRREDPAAAPRDRHARERLAGPDGPRVCLEVQDDGIGMDAATCSRLFEPFFTTKAAGEGTGLGLCTVYGIVKETGGGIEVSSRPGRGTTFRIRLPRAEAEGGCSPDESIARGLTAGTERILLVEDEREVREMAREALEIGGYTVETAESGEDALRTCADGSRDFDLLLTDVVMPGLSGGELAQRLQRERPGLRVLYMSGYNDDAIVHHGVQVAEAAFLQKPFTLEALSRKVREVLDGAVQPARS